MEMRDQNGSAHMEQQIWINLDWVSSQLKLHGSEMANSLEFICGTINLDQSGLCVWVCPFCPFRQVSLNYIDWNEEDNGNSNVEQI